MLSILNSLSLQPPYVIVGTGITGSSLQRLLLKIGVAEKDLHTFDKSDPGAQYQDHEKLLLEVQPKTLFISPGVPLSTAWIKNFADSGGRISSELEVAFAFLTTEKIIAVTGSIGKSTTTSLIGAAARAFSPSAFVGGNLGTPLADYIYDIQSGRSNPTDYVTLELSSYQLENFKNLVADVAVLTYLSPNHLERYTGLEDYYQTKLQLLRSTEGFIVVNKDGGDNISVLANKDFSPTPVIWTSKTDETINTYDLKNSMMLGTHNLENLAMAAKVAELLKWPPSAFTALKVFPGLSHRLENCGKYHGIQFINDSKATAMDAVLQASQSIAPLVERGHRLHLLLGGRDKNLPWQQLKALKQEQKLSVTFFGEFASGAKDKTELEGSCYPTLKEALENSCAQWVAGDVVLLSPGGTSLDEFKGFEDRGNFFKSWLKTKFQN